MEADIEWGAGPSNLGPSHPLLPRETEASLEGPFETGRDGTPSPTTKPFKPRPLSFYDNYRVLNGVPTFVTQSSDGSRIFTCHALSDDGSLIATGDEKGRIRIWCSSCCSELTGVSEDLFSDRIRGISFYGGRNDCLIAFGTSGMVKVFEIEMEPCCVEGRDRLGAVSATKCTVLPHRPIPNGARSVQFSRDGTVIAFRVHDHTEQGKRCSHLIFQITDSTLKFVELVGPRSILLSGNGMSVMGFKREDADGENVGSDDIMRTFLPPEVLIWSRLSFEPTATDLYETVIDGQCEEDEAAAMHSDEPDLSVSGERGCWGKDGEYALIWTRTKKNTEGVGTKPVLLIYEISDMKCKRHVSSPRPFKEKELDFGLRSWEARVVDNSHNYPLLVAIYEVFEPAKSRLILWDAMEDVIVSETRVCMDIDLEGSLFSYDERMKWHMLEGEEHEMPENGIITPRTSKRAYDWMLAHNMRPNIAVSRDLTTACFFSWRFETLNITSITSGASVWSLTLPSELKTNPFTRINTCTFNASGRRILILGREAVLSFAPPCLSLDHEAQHQTHEVPQGENGSKEVMSAFARRMQLLPSMVLSRWVAAQLSVREDAKSLIKTPLDGFSDKSRIQDSAISADGTRLVFVTALGEQFCIHRMEGVYESGDDQMHEDADVSFEFRESGDCHEGSNFSTPRKVYLYRNSEKDKDVMLVIGGMTDRQRPCIYDFNSGRVEDLGMEESHMTCLSSTQMGNGQFVLLLSLDRVFVFDLHEKSMEIIMYRMDFERALKFCQLSLWMEWLKPHSRISEDGECVLIGWDAKHRRSILVKNHTTDDESRAFIRAAEGQITSACVLSHDAKWVMYVDPDGLSEGKLTIGFFSNEEESVCRLVTVGKGPLDAMSHDLSMGNLLQCICFAASKDGYELMTVNWTGDNVSKQQIVTTTPYAEQGCLPSFSRFLSIAQSEPNASKTDLVKEMVDCYGCGALNMSHPPGKSFFQEALLRNEEKHMVRAIEEIAANSEFDLAFDWLQFGEDFEPVPVHPLCKGLFPGQRNDVKDLVTAVHHDRVSFDRCSAIVRDAFIPIWKGFPKIIEEQLKDKLVVDVCELDVHADFFCQPQHLGLHIETANTTLEWFLNGDRTSRNRNWRDRHQETIKEWESAGDKSTAKAMLKIVRLTDMAKVGMKGILRRLLINNARDRFFKFDPVKWTIQLKWETFWKERCYRNVAKYLLLVICFTTYATFIGQRGEPHEQESVWKMCMSLPLLLCWCFALDMLYEEVSQIRSLMKDGKDYFANYTTGLRYYARSKWNWVQIISCLMLLLLIPWLHILSCIGPGFRALLCIAVAFESVLVWFKIWYHMQAFDVTGALVLMIYNIIRESLWFLALAAMILFGFSLTFHILFENLSGSDETSDYNKKVDLYFGSLPKSVASLFYALFSNFPAELYLPGSWVSHLICGMFCTYVLIETVVLLNLLIAIMGDTFDKIKSREESQLLKGRAIYIDACESAMSDSQILKMESRIGTYLLALVPADYASGAETSEWSGRLNTIQEMFHDVLARGLQELRDRPITHERLEQIPQMQSDIGQVQSDIQQMQEAQAEMMEQLASIRALLEWKTDSAAVSESY